MPDTMPGDSFAVLLKSRAETMHDAMAYRFLEDGENTEIPITWGELHFRARAVAARLMNSCAPGDRAVLLFQYARDFIPAFFGCLYAGIIGVPAYLPGSRRIDLLSAIVADCSPKLILTTAGSRDRLMPKLTTPENRTAPAWLALDEDPDTVPFIKRLPVIRQETIAFLQYTSGSTGTPRGVIVTHKMLLSNAAAIRRAMNLSGESRLVSWLPLYHDMGLMNGVLIPVYLGAVCTLIPQDVFARKPLCWLRAISRYRGTVSGGPNFAYDLLLKENPGNLADLDLSCWQIAFNGAEPVQAATLDAFACQYAPYGFRAEAFYPCYGMAESVLFVSGGIPGQKPAVFQKEAAAPDQRQISRQVVSCGKPGSGTQVRVVDPATGRLCGWEQPGEIWIAGESVSPGYWGGEKTNSELFAAFTTDTEEGPFFRTGDTGFISGEELYITGRIKDMLIFRGQNYYPRDIERKVAAASPEFAMNGCAVIGVETSGGEDIVVIQELSHGHSRKTDFTPLLQVIAAVMREECGLPAAGIMLIRQGHLPRTTSGKIRRYACLEKYLAGEFRELAFSREEYQEDYAAPPEFSRENIVKHSGSRREEILTAYLMTLLAPFSGTGREQSAVRNFLAAGLDSLALTEIVSRINRQLLLNITVSDLFLYPDGTALSRFLATRLQEESGQSKISSADAILSQTVRPAELPLTYTQERLWFLQQLNPESTAYNLAAAFRLQGAFDERRLELAFDRIIGNHEALRARFPGREGVPCQVITGADHRQLTVKTLSGLPGMTGEQRLEQEIGQELHRPFNLAGENLLRVILYKLGNEEFVLLVCMHHIIADGWSAALLIRELREAYLNADKPDNRLPPLQYGDYVLWQRSHQEHYLSADSLAFWKSRLNGLPVLELPADYIRPPVRSFKGAAVYLKIPGQLTEALKQLSRQQEVTLFTTLLTAWQVLMYRYTGQEDFGVGSPVAGRTSWESREIVGLFINTLVFRAGLGGNPRFAEVLERTGREAAAAYAHQQVPFERIIEQLQAHRELSHAPLFQVMFILQKFPASGFRLPGVAITPLQLPVSGAKCDISLELNTADAELAGRVEYNCDLFAGSTITRLIGHYQKLLEEITENPYQRISELAILTTAEKNQVLADWNSTDLALPAADFISLFEKQAAAAPDRIALSWEDRDITYGLLNAEVNRLARLLTDKGVGPEKVTGVCLARSPELVICLLAVLKAGGAYLPLDPAYPPARLAFMLEDSGAFCLLTRESLKKKLPGAGPAVFCLEKLQPVLKQYGTGNLTPRALPEKAAYIIYTSGSTGRPKGVCVEHRNLVNFLCAMRERPGISSDDIIPAITSVSFDIHILELFLPLICGARIILASRETAGSGSDLQRLMKEKKVTVMQATPVAWQMLLGAGWQPAGQFRVFCGGEAMPAGLKNSLLAFPGLELWNLYGPTETTVWSSCARITAADEKITIGRPVGNTQIYILDADLNPVPAGITGEIYISGAGVARGYLNRPAETEARFLPNPFVLGNTLYRTGDLGRFLPDGRIEFLGRQDAQLKIRGHRIEPGEIEAVILKNPGIRECVVMAGRDENGVGRLLAYITAGEEKPDTALLWKSLQETLPRYLVPDAFIQLASLPLTPNGKVDKKVLALQHTLSRADSPYEAPRNRQETILARLWSELLNIDKPGIDENFFMAGGHSLLASRLLFRINRELKRKLELKTLFEHPTIRELSGWLNRNGGAAEQPVRPAEACIRPADIPLSFAQERLWFLTRLEGDNPAFHIASAFRLRGVPDKQRLEQAFRELILRHEILRTNFISANGIPCQVIHPAANWKITQHDLTGSSGRAELPVSLAQELKRPFNLADGSLFRVILHSLADDESVLLIHMHHIISDGWSAGIVIREIIRLYSRSAEEADFPPPSFQYADFACRQRASRKGQTFAGELLSIKSHLTGLPVLELPADYSRPAVQTYRGAAVTYRLSSELVERLENLGRSQGATLFMVLLAAWQGLLYRYTGQEDFGVGSPIAGRTDPETEDMPGLFVNTLVYRASLQGAPSFTELLKRVKEEAVRAFGWEQVPFEKVIEQVQPHRDPAHPPLFQAMFVFQDIPYTTLTLPGIDICPFDLPVTAAQFDLTLELNREPGRAAGGLTGRLIFNSDLFRAETITRLTDHFTAFLGSITDNPGQSVGVLEWLPAQEKKQLLYGWNRTDAPYAGEKNFVHFFEEQADLHSGEIALLSPAGGITYRELNESANRLAHCLKERGVNHSTVTAICLEKSQARVIAVLGVWKAGGAYLPLDPVYPPARLGFMLEDSGAALLITRQGLLPGLPVAGQDCLCLDTELSCIKDYPQTNPGLTGNSHDTSYVIYTSGSTGKPKGVYLKHQGVTNLQNEQKKIFGLAPGDRVLQFASFSFDAAVWEMTMALGSGAALVLPAEEEVLAGDALAGILNRYGITAVTLPPSVIAQLPESIPSLRIMVSAGEACTRDLIQTWAARLMFYNAYGPTENTVCATIKACSADEEFMQSIGRPLGNTRVYILDKNRQPVPAGVYGEIYLSGDQVAKGYLHRPAETEAAFLSDPFFPGSIMYRSGDRGRFLANGEICFAGRMDEQLKIRGYRVEPGEIEKAILENSVVRECAMIADKDIRGNQRLIAFVTTGGEVLPPGKLLAELKNRLPAYLLPAGLVQLDKLPLTANGKVDRKALVVPDALLMRTADYQPPRNSRDELLARLWSDLLGTEQPGIDDNFFESGGHSLLATRLNFLICRELNISLELKTIFEHPTIRGLSDRIAAAGGTEEPQPVTRQPRPEVIPLSYAQERLWFLDQFEEESSAYHIKSAFRLEGRLDRGLLEKAFMRIINRHEALRTNFKAETGVPCQVIKEAPQWHLELEDLSTAPVADKEIRKAICRATEKPFNLAEDNLIRVILFKRTEKDFVLLVHMHHIIADGWSAGILMRELTETCQALNENREPELPALQIQYADYALWQRAFSDNTQQAAGLHYWEQQLKGMPVLELPADRSRPAVQSYAGSAVPCCIDPELTAELKHLGQRYGATLFMTLLAAWQGLLYRYTGQQDFGIGFPAAGRTRPETAGIIGFFVNTLVFRARLKDDPPFSVLLEATKEQTLAAFGYQQLPFSRLIEKLQPGRNLAHSPLFQVMFALHDIPEAAFRLPGMEISPFAIEVSAVKYALTLELNENRGSLAGRLEYNTDMFNESTMLRLVDHFIRLLKSITSDPGLRISALQMLTPAEERLLESRNRTGVSYPVSRTLTGLFEEQAAAQPEAEALVFRGQCISYGELNEKANRLARLLRDKGVRQGTVAGICLERSVDMITAVLAVLKAGGAYLPLDPAYPAGRLKFMLEDSGAGWLITREAHSIALAAGKTECLRLEKEQPHIDSYAPDNPACLRHPGDPAYIIYTSGSTGKPKGVVMPDRALLNLLWWQQENFRTGRGSRVLQFSSLSFDVSFQEIFSTFHQGSTLFLIGEAQQQDLTALTRFVAENRIQRLFMPFSALRTLAEIACLEKIIPVDLQEVITAGEQLRITPVLRKFFGQIPDCRLNNQYGPTETHVAACYHLTGDPAEWPLLPPVGKAVANTTLHVLDEHGNPLPAVVPGELYIGGIQLADGYLNRPALTADRFTNHPARSGRRLYKTGDRVRYLADGNLEFLGRCDEQLKIRGYRIEPGEIEVAITAESEVREAAVVCDRAQRLLAYIVPGEKGYDPVILHSRLEAQLPAYMIPEIIVFPGNLPRTPSGKIDKLSLAAGDTPAPAAAAYQPPVTPTEKRLAEIWSDVLEVADPGVNVSFFELGGHSLKATILAALIRRAFGINFSVKSVFKYPTICRMAARITEETDGDYTAIPPAGRREYYPLSHEQKRMFTLSHMTDNGTAYNLPWVVKAAGSLDKKKFEEAARRLICRHEILRTGFPIINSSPVQKIETQWHFAAEYAESHAAELDDRISSFIRPFDLKKPPLLRIAVITTAPEEFYLLFDMHHIIGDGTTIDLLTDELMALYNGEQLPSPALQYKDYVLWQETFLRSEGLMRQGVYWKQRFSGGLPVSNLPLDFPRSKAVDFSGKTLVMHLGRELSLRLQTLAREKEATLFILLLAAYQLLFARLCGSADQVTGVPAAVRRHADLRNLPGLMLNTLAIRNYINQEDTFEVLLTEVRQQVLEAYDNQDYPFEKLLDSLDWERLPGRTPLFSTVVNMINTGRGQHLSGTSRSGFTITPYDFDTHIAKYDLLFYIFEEADGITVKGQYRTSLFREKTVRYIMEEYRHLLQLVVDNPRQTVAEFSLFAYEKIGRPKNRLPAPPRNLADEFTAVAEKYGSHIALEEAQTCFTYSELNRRTNLIACALLSHLEAGVRDAVALLFSHGTEMIAAILAVLKSGKFFVPLDPDFPAERLQYILEDTGACALLFGEGQEKKAAALQQESKQKITMLSLASLETETVSSAGAEKAPGMAIDPAQTAYIMYTSGSTGRPKGVMQSHKNIAFFTKGFIRQMHITPNDKLALFTSCSHTVGAIDIFAALLAGSALCPYNIKQEGSIEGMGNWLRDRRITIFHTVPSVYRYFLGQLHDRECVRALRLVILGGESVQQKDLQSFREVFQDNCRFVNLFGSSEVIIAAAHILTGQDEIQGAVVPAGYPVAGVEIRIEDSNGNVVPVLCEGELVFYSPYLSEGYWNRPDLTRQVFTPGNLTHTGTPAYRSGDRGRWLADGSMEYFGRKDNQIKIRGYRIELEEIDMALEKYPGINEAVTVKIETGERQPILAAFYTVSEEKEFKAKELREFLLLSLPEYMTPRHFIALDKLPLTPNGKLDRRALTRDKRILDRMVSYEPAHTEREQKILTLWQEVLDIERIGINDNFFDIGGDSLRTTSLFFKLNEMADVEIQMRDLFEHQTIKQQAAYMNSLEEEVAGDTETDTPQETVVQNDHPDNPPGLPASAPADTPLPERGELDIVIQTDISVYLFRAMPLCIVLTDEKMRPWYYEHYINLYSRTDTNGYLTMDFLEVEYVYSTFLDLGYIGYDLMSGLGNILDYTRKCINLGYYVNVFLDEYYLAAKGTYQTRHFVHDSVIYGYDNTTRTLLAAGYDAGMQVAKITFGYDEFVMAYEQGKNHCEETGPWAKVKAVQIYKKMDFAEAYPFDLNRFLSELGNYVHGRGNSDRLYSLRLLEDRMQYGIRVYDDILEHMQNLLKGKFTMDYRCFHLLHEHTNLLLDRLRYVKKKYNGEFTNKNFFADYGELAEKTNHIRKLFFQAQKDILASARYGDKPFKYPGRGHLSIIWQETFFDAARFEPVLSEIADELETVRCREKKLLQGVYGDLCALLRKEPGFPVNTSLEQEEEP